MPSPPTLKCLPGSGYLDEGESGRGCGAVKAEGTFANTWRGKEDGPSGESCIVRIAGSQGSQVKEPQAIRDRNEKVGRGPTTLGLLCCA